MLRSIAASYWAHALFPLVLKTKCYDITKHSSFVCASVVLPLTLLHDYASLALPEHAVASILFGGLAWPVNLLASHVVKLAAR